jgi:hypothetical protein
VHQKDDQALESIVSVVDHFQDHSKRKYFVLEYQWIERGSPIQDATEDQLRL